jgi:hypothetical protein
MRVTLLAITHGGEKLGSFVKFEQRLTDTCHCSKETSMTTPLSDHPGVGIVDLALDHSCPARSGHRTECFAGKIAPETYLRMPDVL